MLSVPLRTCTFSSVHHRENTYEKNTNMPTNFTYWQPVAVLGLLD